MADPQFFINVGPFRLSKLAEITGASLADGADPDREIKDVATLDMASSDDLSFLDNKKYISAFKVTQAGACFVHPDFVKDAPDAVMCLVSDAPYKAYALAAQAFYPDTGSQYSGISETAFVDNSAALADDVIVESGAHIGRAVKIGAGSVIGANAVIREGVEIGENCEIGPNATVSHALIGNNVLIYPGAQIGQRGFGFALGENGYVSVPQLGRVIIEEDVEVGANSTIDRGTLGDTVIGAGSRIDNLVQIGHNVKLGRCCVVVAHVGISGSTEFGDFVMAGGQAGFAGHLKIGSGARVAAQSGVMRDVAPGEEVMGSPAVPAKQYMRQIATVQKMAKGKRGMKEND